MFLEPAAIRSGGGERPRRRLRGHGALRWGAAPIDVADGPRRKRRRRPHEKGLAAEVAEAIVDALRRQERRNALPEIFVCAQYLWAEMVRRHDLY